ncbi:MAG TPA: hydrogenase formation protein HypD [Candidatus Altiarchaeales archaeon]|nr:hydrogenase formation protein HypD [Candidatus Altiarchaeales archaeon]HEX54742.1 hydrogenase formation protein HypD [Candidatus Altiarchaeales archaeon]
MLHEFRDKSIAKRLSGRIRKISKGMGHIKIMHVCGTHEYTITRFGIRSLLPENIEVISGPGCPVCVTTTREIDEAILLSKNEDVIVTTFGDMLRVPGSESSLVDAKSRGCDVRVVYSISDAVEIARENSRREVIHVAIGFETTSPSTAVEIKNAPENFSILNCHRLIPPAMEFLMERGNVKINGFINPGHVSTIIGLRPYYKISEKYNVPQVIAGFEPNDVLFAILILLDMIKNGEFEVRNEYSRVVREEGNLRAIKAINEVFKPSDVKWRGFPEIPGSGLKLRNRFLKYDAREKFDINLRNSKEPKGCRCGDILKGTIHPRECPLFSKICIPENPIGPCMVSMEGACAIAYRYGSE